MALDSVQVLNPSGRSPRVQGTKPAPLLMKATSPPP